MHTRTCPTEESRFNGPIGIAISASGTFYVADTYNDKIRMMNPQGVVSTLAGSATGFVDGTTNAAMFDTPCSLVLDALGNIFVANTRNNAIRKILPSGDVSTIFASSPEDRQAILRRPIGLAIIHDNYLCVGENGHAQVDFLHIDKFVSGIYLIRIFAADYAGNVAQSNRDLTIRIE